MFLHPVLVQFQSRNLKIVEEKNRAQLYEKTYVPLFDILYMWHLSPTLHLNGLQQSILINLSFYTICTLTSSGRREERRKEIKSWGGGHLAPVICNQTLFEALSYYVSSQCGWQLRQSSHSQPPKAPLTFISGHCSQTQNILLGAPKAWRVRASKFGGEGSEAKGRCGKVGGGFVKGLTVVSPCCPHYLPSSCSSFLPSDGTPGLFPANMLHCSATPQLAPLFASRSISPLWPRELNTTFFNLHNIWLLRQTAFKSPAATVHAKYNWYTTGYVI